MSSQDKMIRAIAGDQQIRAFAISGKELVEKARLAHHTTNVATAALGRLLCGTVMMGFGMLKNDDDLVTVKEEVMAAGGYIVQLMPFAEDKTIDRLEQNIKALQPVTELLSKGCSPEDMLEQVLTGFDVEIQEEHEVSFYCNCDKDRIRRALVLLGQKELDSIIKDGKDIEIRCQFCGKRYQITLDELKRCAQRR